MFVANTCSGTVVAVTLHMTVESILITSKTYSIQMVILSSLPKTPLPSRRSALLAERDPAAHTWNPERLVTGWDQTQVCIYVYDYIEMSPSINQPINIMYVEYSVIFWYIFLLYKYVSYAFSNAASWSCEFVAKPLTSLVHFNKSVSHPWMNIQWNQMQMYSE